MLSRHGEYLPLLQAGQAAMPPGCPGGCGSTWVQLGVLLGWQKGRRNQRDDKVEACLPSATVLVSSLPLARGGGWRGGEAHVHQKDVEIVYVLLLAWCQGERLDDLGTVGTLFIESRSSGFCGFF